MKSFVLFFIFSIIELFQVQSLGQIRPVLGAGNSPLLKEGYWLSKAYKRGVNPDRDSSFFPINYIYSDGKNYFVSTYRDEEHKVFVKVQRKGCEELEGLFFNQKFLSRNYESYKFLIIKQREKFYLICSNKFKTFKSELLIRKSNFY